MRTHTKNPGVDKKANAKAKSTAEPQAEVQGKAAAKSTPHSARAAKAEPETEADQPPQNVRRVQELYEELGREDVRAAQKWDQAHEEKHKDDPHK